MLSTKQLSTLQTAVDHIIPPDDFPSGWEAGVGDYLLRQLEHDLKVVVDIYSTALDALDTEAQTIYGQEFTALDVNSQDALLSNIERGQVSSTWSVNPADFFKMLVNHTMEGFYSDPGNGGNRDAVSWKMIGFEVTG